MITDEQMIVSLHEIYATERNEDDYALLSYHYLANLIGMNQEAKNKNFRVSSFLEEFVRNVESVDETKYNRNTHQARYIKINWPNDVQCMIDREMKREFDAYGRVFWNGKVFTEVKRIKNLKTKREDALKTMKEAKNPVTRKFVEYFNNLPETIFTSIIDKNFDKAVINSLSDPNKSRNLRMLANIFDSPKPFLKGVENSSRAYPIGENLVTVESKIRKDLTSSWVELDLKHCQLAIAAKLWGMSDVQVFLKDGKNFWEYVAEEMGLKLTKDLKGKIKGATYATLYGASSKQFPHIMGEEMAKKYLSVPLVSTMCKSARKQLTEIRNNKGATDAFGTFISLSSVVVEDGKDKAKSLLSQINQSYEASLLEPVIDLANTHLKDRNGFYITLYQYDGISIISKKPGHQEYWTNRVQQVVTDKATAYGFNTQLI